MRKETEHVARHGNHERPVEEGGWRAGKPLEDPEKLKRWGFVSAKPSEYLVHVRRGEVRQASSGQGVTCFKWPWDAVAVVPTSLQRLQFRADQVTVEKVGIEVVGLAVYRIADPLLAFRVLNFAYPERAQLKLEETLTSMFVGATRRLVANLTVDECLQKRKSALACELLKEIAPVVGGRGRPDDQTTQGWGLVIDTIEIQEVRVSSASVFAAMQAPFRAAVEQQARAAKAEAERDIATREAACNRTIEEARIAAELAVREKRMLLEQAALKNRREEALARVQVDAEVASAKLSSETAAAREVAEAEVARRQAQATAHVQRQALAAQEAEAELVALPALVRATEQRAALARIEQAAALAARREERLVAELEANDQAAARLHQAQAYEVEAAAQARLTLAQKLPELAAAVGQRFGEVKVVQIGGVENAFGSIAQALQSVLAMAKSGT